MNKEFAIFVELLIVIAIVCTLVALLVAPTGGSAQTPKAFACCGTTYNYAFETEEDSITSGNHSTIAHYGLSVTNTDDDSNTTLGELVYHVEADGIGDVWLSAYADRTSNSVTWTFPPEFDLVEGDSLHTGYTSSYTETRNIPYSLSRSIDKTVFESDGNQSVEFTVAFDYAMPAYVQIHADQYDQIEEVDAFLNVGTFSTDIPYTSLFQMNEHEIYLVLGPGTILEPGREYHLSVDIEVKLNPTASLPIVYKPSLFVGTDLSMPPGQRVSGYSVVLPDAFLPEHMHAASASTNVYNEWYLWSSNQISAGLLEIHHALTTPTPVTGIAREVNGNILPGVSITLDGIGPVVSDQNGQYEILATATGNYTVTAHKDGFRDRTQIIEILGLGPEFAVTCNFQGAYGLIPNAPDIWYALDCVNLWLYPPNPDTSLDIWTALDVINAWLYPVQ